MLLFFTLCIQKKVCVDNFDAFFKQTITSKHLKNQVFSGASGLINKCMDLLGGCYAQRRHGSSQSSLTLGTFPYTFLSFGCFSIITFIINQETEGNWIELQMKPVLPLGFLAIKFSTFFEKTIHTYRFLIRLATVISSGNIPYMQYSKCSTKFWIFLWRIKIAKSFKYIFDGGWIIT